MRRIHVKPVWYCGEKMFHAYFNGVDIYQSSLPYLYEFFEDGGDFEIVLEYDGETVTFTNTTYNNMDFFTQLLTLSDVALESLTMGPEDEKKKTMDFAEDYLAWRNGCIINPISSRCCPKYGTKSCENPDHHPDTSFLSLEGW